MDESADEVFLEGLSFYGYHGVNPEERTLGQRFVVDVAVRADLGEAARTDDVRRTVSYSAIYTLVRGIVEGRPQNLLEAVAEEIATLVLGEFSLAESVTVTIRKPAAPIQGAVFDAAGVRIRRDRGPVRS